MFVQMLIRSSSARAVRMIGGTISRFAAWR